MDKQHAHQMLDQLDPGQLDAVVRLLEVLTDPATPLSEAPIDDEPESEEEARAVAASKEWFRNHKGIPLEEVAADLGFTMEQIRGPQGIRLKRIVFSEQAKADIRAIPQPIAMNILTAIHRLAETGAGRVKTLQGQSGEKRLRVGDYRVRFTEESGEDKARQ